MNPIQFPAFLKPGDRVGVLAPASIVKYDDVIPGIRLFTEQWRLEVVEGKTLRTSFNQFSASDEDRLADMQHMLDDPSIKAIIAARGGYGCSRIVDDLRFDKFVQNPKWIVGFSDLTAFLARTFQLGYASIHAPMAKTITCAGAEIAAESLRQMLFGELPGYEVPAHRLNRAGQATAQVVGGNLCLLAHMIGSETETNTDGKILFIEDINEYLYNLDRMMIQLKRSGKLAKLAGLVVGQFTDMKDNNSPTFGKDSYEIIAEHVTEYDYPVCYDFPVGHVGDNRAMGVGMGATFKVSEQAVELRFLSNSTAV
ncbi:muramoyltetrapeptide carboxypeptidase [Dyadobacter sp. BE34]|uniref:Muramoyltetrapeptide carboxypeptidase n=1 Tax=Dyadobacter fermentans TaxID=94254 RepID=A0ABU1R133_9BACT|nr:MULTISPECIES: LD-carboxypeptidase [Dyadobacter]MDR6807112.1 muramoyltetrapeptide carboxypeptidase [Dyadobacter fermentans]MDR7044853.1 muramoyltetrapeptide carboxypeptidase [Dyadobacter sp. BE242]MDR7199411.1 muramoyltetrapeptide carboxypeptidase [Dyadobacter sp. BE34]MDR7217371.1 muramoyltetrapeptide carboxypeptidase [Dyadobacter sp. BE31]MDR7265303.1 muramoyltetrapeptide carboxypeptidase [Dyadobacter sp. BE32]